MKVLAAAIFLIASVTAESAYLDLGVFPGAGGETKAAAMDAVMNVSLLEKVSSGIEFAVDDVGHDEWVRSLAEVSMEANTNANTNTNTNEDPAEETGAGEKEETVLLKALIAKNADITDELRAVNARLEELESKKGSCRSSVVTTLARSPNAWLYSLWGSSSTT